VGENDRLVIGGALVEAAGGATYPDIDPTTEAELGQAADGGPADVDAAIAAARAAFDDTSWSTDVALRVRCLRQLQAGLERNLDALRDITIAEAGAPVALTHGAQLDTPVENIGWVADLLERYEWETDLGVAEPFGMPARRWYRREAAGVVAAITPWNFPNQINLAKVAPALAAGCTVVLKPAPDTPWTGVALGRIALEETDIPPGVLNVVTSSGHEVGRRLAEDPRVDLVSLTGSTATGRKVLQAAAGNLKRVFLELGGKSAAVVLDDADLAAAAGATGMQVMTHAGQGCAITTRLVVPRDRYDEAVGAVVELMSSMPYGDPRDPSHLMGPLINAHQRDRVLDYIERAVDDGATVALGGSRPTHLPVGYFVEPTVLTGVDPRAAVAQEEVFGPVLVVLAHDGDDDAVRIADDTPYGLSGAVFSASPDRARAVANRLRTGTVSVNGGLWYGPDVPFGGYKASGIGREMGVLGFEEYTEVKGLAEPA
jgi:aldehyde dehydrogenase (NAD+)